MKKINIKGAIVSNEDKWIYDLFEMDSTCPKDVMDELEGLTGEPVSVTINSGGGDVYSASEIYTELKDYPGDVGVRIVGIAASAASVIAMAGNVKMSPTAQIMIHNASTIAYGDHNAMNKASDFLQSVNRSIASAYQKKTGLSQDELLELMNKETWLTAEEAKEKGFVDEIMFDEQVKAVASAPGALPPQVINKIRNDELKKPDTVTVDEIKNLMSQMKSEIINELKGKEPIPEPPKANLGKLFLNL